MRGSGPCRCGPLRIAYKLGKSRVARHWLEVLFVTGLNPGLWVEMDGRLKVRNRRVRVAAPRITGGQRIMNLTSPRVQLLSFAEMLDRPVNFV